MAIVSETGEPEEVTTEHIFDTVSLIDPSVKSVSSDSRDGSYRVVCDFPEMVRDILDKKMIGNNIIHLSVARDAEVDTYKPCDEDNSAKPIAQTNRNRNLLVSFLVVCVGISLFFLYKLFSQ